MVVDIGHTSALDLMALRIPAPTKGERILLPAAGLPWFLGLFGRDTLITTYQTMSYGSMLAKGALLATAHHQGRKVDDFPDEEPGRLLHEVRAGELARPWQGPHRPHRGTA